jgi:hypothetical protein
MRREQAHPSAEFSHQQDRRFPATAVIGLLLLGAFVFSSCGGGSTSGGGGGNPPPTPDFALSVPGSVTVGQGSSMPLSVTVTAVNGFSSLVSVTISGLPAGVTAVPANFTLAVGASQQVMISATGNAAAATTNLSVTGVSGALQHVAPVSLKVTASGGGGGGGGGNGLAAASRVRFVQTDTQWDTGFLTFFPQRLIIYDPGTKRFFLSDPSLNLVDVIDAASEQKIAEIPVPGAFVGDETPDNKTIYLGTQIGDVYQIDPIAMAVVQRFPSVQIGPGGFAAYQTRVLADGRVLLAGGQGGIPSVDGYSEFGIWNPTTNALNQFGANPNAVGSAGPTQPICGGMMHIAEFAVTADRTQILVSSADSDGTLCMFNPDSLAYLVVQANSSQPIMTPPDGKEIITASGNLVSVFDTTSLFQTDQFTVGGGSVAFNYVLSPDGNTLYAVGEDEATALAINWRTHQQLGWFLNYQIYDNPFASVPVPFAVDETGLIANAIGHGVAFLDGGALLSTAPARGFPFGYTNVMQPTFGPVQGGTQAVITGVAITNVADVDFGTQAAAVVSTGSNGIAVTTPAASPGPVDVSMIATDNSFLFLPKAYSYGPSIVEVRPDASSADGGGTGTIFGYGFGSASFNGQAPGLQVSVGGQPATITQYFPQPYSQVPWYPFPLEAVNYTIPAGSRGTSSSVTISSSGGSVTASNAIQYEPAIQQFPLAGAVLVQGIYDRTRNLYYFTDQTQVRVFSRSSGQFRASIPMPAGASRLWGIALSPDGSKLAVSDAGTNVIYVLNPTTPSSVQTFTIPNTATDEGEQPGGLAITDSGIVYYASFNLNFDGGPGLHKLDTSTGIVTDYTNTGDLALGDDVFLKVLLTSDNKRVFFNDEGVVLSLDTATDTMVFNPTIVAGDYELTLASNQTWMSATEYMMDTNLNPESYLVYVDRDVWSLSAVYGEKMSPDGNLLFLPLTNAIDVIDGKQGVLLTRIALPVALSSNYDALVDDGQDNVLVAITGNTGSGIAVIDLSSLAEPLAAARAGAARAAPRPATEWIGASTANLKSLLSNSKTRPAAALSSRPRHNTTSPALTYRR